MYSRAEVSQMRQTFWTTFGQYMMPQLSAEGERVNWINYKTGEKNIQFKMHADTTTAYIGVVLTHTDAGVRHLYFEQLVQLKTLFERQLNEAWSWQLRATDEAGPSISQVFTTCDGVNIMKRDDWPGLISFFKPRIVSLDAFWNEAKYAFEALR